MIIKTLLLVLAICSCANAEELLSWDVENSPLGNLNNGTSNQPFDDINIYGGGAATISDDYANSGDQSIRIAYPSNEAGVSPTEIFAAATLTLYTRKYEYFESNWEGDWPIGLKTSRYYTAGTTYHSEKLIWQTYDATCNELYGLGSNSAIYNLDLQDTYGASELFGNGLPYIRTGHWYKFETWMVMNSADDVADGVLQLWIDDVLVYDNQAVAWESTTRGATGGLDGWTAMWFGGNYSGAICGSPDQTLYRYIDDMYLSTTLDRQAAQSHKSTASFR